MSDATDRAKLKKGLKELQAAGITEPFYYRAAAILYEVNGLENALGYVSGVIAQRVAQEPTSKIEIGENNEP